MDEQQDQIRNHVGYVYFIRCLETGRIKIGYSFDDPRRRLLTFKVASPTELEKYGMMRGSMQDEAGLKSRFHRHNVKGEWFRPHASLLAFIRENAKGWDELLDEDSEDWMLGGVQIPAGVPDDRRRQPRVAGLKRGGKSKAKRPVGRPKKVGSTRPIPARYGPLQAMLDKLKADETTEGTTQ